MTTEVKEDNANPYNEKKSWHGNEEDKAFEGADGMFFNDPSKAKPNDDVEQPVDHGLQVALHLSLIHISEPTRPY